MAIIVETSVEVNEYEKFRKPIQDIINFTNTIDEKYREKCFEVLLNHSLCKGFEIKSAQVMQVPIIQANTNVTPEFQGIPSDLQLFLKQYEISPEVVNKLFLREKGVLKPIYKITDKRKAIAQIQVTLLTAFENALSTPNAAFEFPMKAARQRCSEYDVYDGNNFYFNYRTRAGLFTNLDTEVVKLTPVGKSELADLLVFISKQC